MNIAENSEQFGSVAIIKKVLGDGLKPGELGILLSRAGGGKTACLTYIALEQLLRGLKVLHVCIDEKPDTIKTWYHELLKNIASTQPGVNPNKLYQTLEPLRFILTYVHHTFTPEKLQQSLNNLRDQAHFAPALVVLDGLDFDRVDRTTVEAIQLFARSNQLPIWMSARTHRHRANINEHGVPYPCHEMDDLFQVIAQLEPIADAIRLSVIKHNDRYMPGYQPMYLNPQTFILQSN